MLGDKFHQLKVRCSTIRACIVKTVHKYLSLVNHESEVKFLLLEKDFENRDALDLITHHSIFEFLES